MKNLKHFTLTLITCLLFLGVLVGFGWPTIDGPVLLKTDQGGGQYKFSFDPTTLPIPTPNDPNTPHDFDNWKVFVNFDDGTHWMGTKAQFEKTSFVFGDSRTYNVYAELTPTYDDGSTNPGRTATIPVNNTTISQPWTSRLTPMASNQIVKLECNRAPKPGDMITFIVTCKNTTSNPNSNGEMPSPFYFTYDSRAIQPIDVEVYNPNGGGKNTSATLPVPTVLSPITSRITLDNVAGLMQSGEQKQIYIRCTTNLVPVNMVPAYVPPMVEVKIGGLAGTDALSDQVLVDGHDPNQKYPLSQSICLDQGYVDYTIAFQNDGNGPTNTVVVKDELDTLINASIKPVVMSHSTPYPPSMVGNGREMQFTIQYSGDGLRGLHETGYGVSFTEEDTKDQFTVRYQLKPMRTQFPCNALVNKASIYFDCNVPVQTNTSLVKFNCSSCDTTCVTLPDSTFVIATPLEGDQEMLPADAQTWLSSLGFNLNSTSVKCKWYPSTAVHDPFTPNPYCINPKQLDYTLVVSSSAPCKRQIIHLKYPDPCTLGIQIDASNLVVNPCARTISGYLTATATGTTSTGADLQWHRCTVTGDTFAMQVSNDVFQYHFGLTDKKTGCTKEVVYSITMPLCKKRWWEQISLSQWALAAAIGLGLGLIWRFLRKNR
ncbi:MAG: hypothetical protein JNJ57_02670 [Saprospiraceae bacterium]|nr:hypothetical protein [Saprospiraceae bacterium]